MKITRQPRLNALAADGTAPIQLTSSWEGNRLGTGPWYAPSVIYYLPLPDTTLPANESNPPVSDRAGQ